MSDTPLTAEAFLLERSVDVNYKYLTLPVLAQLLTVFAALKVRELYEERDVLKLTVQRLQDHLEAQRLATYQAVARERAAKQQLSAVQTELAALQCRRDW